jgi:hypothetical protein
VDTSEIRGWFQGYLDAFASTVKDPSESGGMLKFWAVPLILAGDDEAQVLTSEGDVLAMGQRTAAGFKSEQFSHSELLDSDLIEINGSTALLRGKFSRRRTDGTEIQRVEYTYLIARSVQGLRIFMMAAPRARADGDDRLWDTALNQQRNEKS